MGGPGSGRKPGGGHKGTSSEHSRSKVNFVNYTAKHKPVGTSLGKWIKYKKHNKNLRSSISSRRTVRNRKGGFG